MSGDGEGKMNRPPPPGENRPPPPENQNGIVASLAHEINNPLAALLNLLHLIESEVPLTNKGRQYLALSHEEVQRISNILHTAMEFRDAGDPEETNVPALLRSVLDFYRSRFAAGHLAQYTLLSCRDCSRVPAPIAANVLQPLVERIRRHATRGKDICQDIDDP
jgi:signal transduction histidine kinase